MCATIADALADCLERSGRDAIDGITRDEMTSNLLVAEHRFKLAHQIARADNIHSKATHEFYCAGVYQPDVWNCILRRILHGKVAIRSNDLLQISLQFLP